LYFLALLAVWVELAVAEAFEGDSGVWRGLVLQEEDVVFAMGFEVAYDEASLDIARSHASLSFYMYGWRRRGSCAGWFLRENLRGGTKKPDC
jgi:hypothetical protein